MYLLDTGIVLALRQARALQPDAGLLAWAGGIPRQQLFISALALLEIENAAARLGRKDRAAGLAVRDWIDHRVMPAFAGRVLPVDAAVVRRRAQLPYANTRDGLLAATALEHGLTLVTQRIPAFRAGRVKLLNPSGYVAPPGEDDEDWSQGTQTGHQWLKNLYTRA
ncbi:PIN domain-containing protein [Roseateles sp. LKC17W]|uniref:PIN domain-containing protein n=1 Tax=Pelomonas margarita TaxID=3299031 RepID=A0ABW7FMD5_9BURK